MYFSFGDNQARAQDQIHDQGSVYLFPRNFESTIPFMVSRAKRRHVAIAREVLLEFIKVNQGFIGLFLAGGIGHWFGFATHKGVYEALGSADTKGQLHESSKGTACAMCGMSLTTADEAEHKE